MDDYKFFANTHARDKNVRPMVKKSYKYKGFNHMAKKCPENYKTLNKVKEFDIEASDGLLVMSLKDDDKDCLHYRVATATVEFLVISKVVTVKCQLDTAATLAIITFH